MFCLLCNISLNFFFPSSLLNSTACFGEFYSPYLWHFHSNLFLYYIYHWKTFLSPFLGSIWIQHVADYRESCIFLTSLIQNGNDNTTVSLFSWRTWICWYNVAFNVFFRYFREPWSKYLPKLALCPSFGLLDVQHFQLVIFAYSN